MKFPITRTLVLAGLVAYITAAPALWAKVSGGRRTQDKIAQAANRNYVDGDTLVSNFLEGFTDFDFEQDFSAFIQANLPDIEKRLLNKDT